MASVDYYYKKNMAALDENMKKSIADSNTIYENQAKSTKDKYNAQIDLSNQEYDDSLRTNEVQKYINMREVAENNANLGLTDSGLNRTQSTAVQVSASNNAAKIERDRTNMVAALTGEMNRYLAEIENNRISSEASIRQGYESKAMEAAQSSYKADVDAAAKANEAAIKRNANQMSDYTSIIKDLVNDDTSPTVKLSEIFNYVNTYDLDLGETNYSNSDVDAMLEAAGLTADEWKNYFAQRNGISIQKKIEAGDQAQSEVPLNERKWTLTYNGGANGFLGLGKWLGNIDNDARVKDQYGNEYSMENLYKELQSPVFGAGLTPADAKDYIVKLQKNLGAH